MTKPVDVPPEGQSPAPHLMESYGRRAFVATVLMVTPWTWPVGAIIAWGLRADARRRAALSIEALPGHWVVTWVCGFALFTLAVWAGMWFYLLPFMFR